MTTVAEVLREFGYQTTEADVAESLTALLHRPAATLDLSGADEAFLDRYSGVVRASAQALSKLDARSAATAAMEAAATLTRAGVAELLGVDASRVSHQASAGELYSYRGRAGRPLFPDWQFAEHSVLPGLRTVLRALPAGTHPVPVRSFMTTADDELLISGHAASPRSWLLSGGAPEPVAALAATLGEQV